jgi:hypothetical protein
MNPCISKLHRQNINKSSNYVYDSRKGAGYEIINDYDVNTPQLWCEYSTPVTINYRWNLDI